MTTRRRPLGGGLDGLNRYAYCRNNPVNYVDPDGYDPHKLQTPDGKGIDYEPPAGLHVPEDDPGEVTGLQRWNALSDRLSAFLYPSLNFDWGLDFRMLAAQNSSDGQILLGVGNNLASVCEGAYDTLAVIAILAPGLLDHVLSGSMRGYAPTSGRLTFSQQMTPEEAARYQAYWQRKAPDQVAPGTGRIDWTRISGRTGIVEESRVIFDDYGRQIYRVDQTNHMRPEAHSNPHFHLYEYGPGYNPYKETVTNY